MKALIFVNVVLVMLVALLVSELLKVNKENSIIKSELQAADETIARLRSLQHGTRTSSRKSSATAGSTRPEGEGA